MQTVRSNDYIRRDLFSICQHYHCFCNVHRLHFHTRDHFHTAVKRRLLQLLMQLGLLDSQSNGHTLNFGEVPHPVGKDRRPTLSFFSVTVLLEFEHNLASGIEHAA